MALILFLVFTIFLQGALGELVCEELPVGLCSFSIASSGKRCLLETYTSRGGTMEFQCKTSEIVVKNIREHVENDDCTRACGVNRNWAGISSDSLLERQFTSKLCSPSCYQNCPNIIDLYYNLALGEGVFLPNLCKLLRTSPRRGLQILSSGAAAAGPVSAASVGAGGPAASESSTPFDRAPSPM